MAPPELRTPLAPEEAGAEKRGAGIDAYGVPGILPRDSGVPGIPFPNTYLRALAAIAQIVQDAEFDAGWLRAKAAEDLRGVVLLCERKREEML